MLFLLTLIVFATLLGAQAHPLSVEDKEKLFVYHKACLSASGVEEETLSKFCNGGQVDDPKLKEYLFCVSKKLGFQDEAGEIQIETIKAKLMKRGHNSTEIDGLVEKCAIKKETGIETAFNVFTCYRENVLNFDGLLYVFSLTPTKTRKLLKYHRECIEETSVNEEIVKKTYDDGEYSDDPVFKTYLLCMSKKFGFQNADGKLQRDVITKKINDAIKNSAKAEKLLEFCVSEKESPEDTAHAMMKCFGEKSYFNLLPIHELSQEKVDKLFMYHRECKKQTSVDKVLVLEARFGNFTEDPALKEYFFCISKKVGFQNEKGELQKDVLKQKVTELSKESVSQQLLEKCAVEKESPVETAFSVVKCYYENTPHHVHIFQNRTLTAEQKEKYQKFNTECLAESGQDSEAMEQIKKGVFSEDEKFKSHLFCFYKKLGLQNESGEIQFNPLRKFVKLFASPKLSEQLNEKCALQMESPTDTAYKAFICYYENTHSNFNVFTRI